MKGSNKRETGLAPFLAFIIPGAGHLALGLHLKGLLLLTGTLADIAAMIRFAGDAGGANALLLVLLGLSLPVFWFYSVYDTLQQRARLQRSSGGLETGTSETWLQGAAVIAVGLVLLLLVREPSSITPWVDEAGTFIPGIGLAVIAVLLAVNKGKMTFKLGRITAAAAILAIGGVLLSDRILDRNDISVLGQWWPAAFVLLGIEVVVTTMMNRTGARRVTFDFGGGFLAVVIALSVFVVTQYSSMPFKWLDQFKVNFAGMSGYGEEKGFKYAKEPIFVPLPAVTSSIEVDNPNGKVTMQKGDVAEMRIESVIWVDVTDKKVADEVAQASKIEVSDGKKLKIEAKGKPYGDKDSRKPRINIIITVPSASHIGQIPDPGINPDVSKNNETSLPSDSSIGADGSSGEQVIAAETPSAAVGGSGASAETDAPAGTGNPNNGAATGDPSEGGDFEEPVKTGLSIEVENGAVDVTGLVFTGGVQINVTTGEISLRDVTGPADVRTKNGSIIASDINGSLRFETYNGSVKAHRIGDGVEGSALSGSIELVSVTGDVQVDTRNGQIDIAEAAGDINADTLNGGIMIRSATVGGDWDIDSSIGEIHLFVPETGDYSVNGSVTFGQISTDLPLVLNEKKIKGVIGAGTYRINIDANSSVSVDRYTRQ